MANMSMMTHIDHSASMRLVTSGVLKLRRDFNCALAPELDVDDDCVSISLKKHPCRMEKASLLFEL